MIQLFWSTGISIPAPKGTQVDGATGESAVAGQSYQRAAKAGWKRFRRALPSIFCAIPLAFGHAARAEEPAEFVMIQRLFPDVKLQDCRSLPEAERSTCRFSQLRLGYFSWGLYFAMKGYNLSLRTRPDLGGFDIFPGYHDGDLTDEADVLAFLKETLDICNTGRCEDYFGLPREALNALSRIYEESRSTVLCLMTRDKNLDLVKEGDVSDRTILFDVMLIHEGLIPSCHAPSPASDTMLRRTFKGR